MLYLLRFYYSTKVHWRLEEFVVNWQRCNATIPDVFFVEGIAKCNAMVNEVGRILLLTAMIRAPAGAGKLFLLLWRMSQDHYSVAGWLHE
jgi:hypothetical protein